ncbi:MAG: hypothetical protein QOI73_2306, partial [Solirubrobacteraceae bacterium]|nr:hypothetical protein [Solirubrobacteraceae bacterium]
AEERAQAAERRAHAAHPPSTQALEAANEALTRLLKACDALEGQGVRVEDLASRVARLERSTDRAPAPAPGQMAPQGGAAEPSAVQPSPPATAPDTEAVHEAAPAPAPAAGDDPAQAARDTPRGLRRLVSHKGGG